MLYYDFILKYSLSESSSVAAPIAPPPSPNSEADGEEWDILNTEEETLLIDRYAIIVNTTTRNTKPKIKPTEEFSCWYSFLDIFAKYSFDNNNHLYLGNKDSMFSLGFPLFCAVFTANAFLTTYFSTVGIAGMLLSSLGFMAFKRNVYDRTLDINSPDVQNFHSNINNLEHDASREEFLSKAVSTDLLRENDSWREKVREMSAERAQSI